MNIHIYIYLHTYMYIGSIDFPYTPRNRACHGAMDQLSGLLGVESTVGEPRIQTTQRWPVFWGKDI